VALFLEPPVVPPEEDLALHGMASAILRSIADFQSREETFSRRAFRLSIRRLDLVNQLLNYAVANMVHLAEVGLFPELQGITSGLVDAEMETMDLIAAEAKSLHEIHKEVLGAAVPRKDGSGDRKASEAPDAL
jgi:hypothetical protein